MTTSACTPRITELRSVVVADRRTIGRAAGILMTLCSLAALATLELMRHGTLPAGFYVLTAVSAFAGVAWILTPWDKLPARCLHAIPIVATAGIACGIRLVGVYGNFAADYYAFVAVFAAFAFDSRWAVAGHAAFASLASMLPLLYITRHPGNLAAARALTGVLVLFVITGIVTLLREALRKRQRELEDLALHDPLTGVGNYRLLSERLGYEVRRHRRSGQALTVMLLDLDGFKEINDSHGHLVGDRVLREVAQAVASAVRSQDTLARQGGDEFSIVAPETNSEQAACLASRVQAAVGSAMSGALTTSVGWATYPVDADDPGTLLTLADSDLRRAKLSQGRGRETAERAEVVSLAGRIAAG